MPSNRELDSGFRSTLFRLKRIEHEAEGRGVKLGELTAFIKELEAMLAKEDVSHVNEKIKEFTDTTK